MTEGPIMPKIKVEEKETFTAHSRFDNFASFDEKTFYNMIESLKPDEVVLIHLVKKKKGSDSILVVATDTINYLEAFSPDVFNIISMFLTRTATRYDAMGIKIDYEDTYYSLVFEKRRLYGIYYDPIKIDLNKESYDAITEHAKFERKSANASCGIISAFSAFNTLLKSFEKIKNELKHFIENEEDNEEEN